MAAYYLKHLIVHFISLTTSQDPWRQRILRRVEPQTKTFLFVLYFTAGLNSDRQILERLLSFDCDLHP